MENQRLRGDLTAGSRGAADDEGTALSASTTTARLPVRVCASHLRVGSNMPSSLNISSLVSIVAPTTINVLVQGGRSAERALIAETVHDLSGRREGAFIRVNCAAFSLDHFEAELFGRLADVDYDHKVQNKTCFERAYRGTLFLNDVEAIPRSLQRRLLHVLQHRQVTTNSGGRTRRIDVRLIAASRRNLANSVRLSQFDKELYFFLKVFPIEVMERVEQCSNLST